MAIMLNLLHWLIDAILRVDRGRVLNDEFDGETPKADIAAEGICGASSWGYQM